jgi:RNA polymerase sigma-70 factor, ECF subfamily
MAKTEGMWEAGQNRDLVERFRQGDRNAFDSLYESHKDGIYSLICRTLGPDSADDAFQEVFIQIFQSARRFRGDSSFGTWAYRVALNVCRDLARRNKRQVPTTDADPDAAAGGACDPADEATACWTRSELFNALQALTTDERAAVELHYMQSLSYREISGMLLCPNGTIKARVHSAITKLRRKLSHLVEEVDER